MGNVQRLAFCEGGENLNVKLFIETEEKSENNNIRPITFDKCSKRYYNNYRVKKGVIVYAYYK